MTRGTDGEDTARLRLILYGRPDCHLCEVAKEALRPLLREYGVQLVERNVESDPAWEQEYGDQVPVGVIDGSRIFKYRVDPGRLRRALSARSRRPPEGG